jgi:hypothetical protein
LFINEDPDASVCFDFNEKGALDYFSRIFKGLQYQFPLDFSYLAVPPKFKDDEIIRLFRAIRETGECKRYTGWILELPDGKKSPDQPDEPVVHVKAEKDDFSFTEESLHSWFHQLGDLHDKNKKRKIPVTQAVKIGSNGTKDAQILRTLFLTRFSGISLFRRPILQRGDLTEIQNRMEDIYQRYRVVLEKGTLLRVVADESYAWWIIQEKGRLLIPLIALDTHDGSKPGPVRIDYSQITGRNRILSVVDYDFSSAQGSLFLSADHSLTIEDLKPGSFRLFSLQ